ncbi:MAG: protein translocase subunit SecDF [Bacteroidales bacterium]|nr:protein translocase subunit SecDF [Bacteroidales bacterium]
MQNKGAVRAFAIILALVCLYQLSFTFFTKKVESDAKEAAAGDIQKEAAYLDSIANEPIYNFLWLKKYTYMECKGKEINFGLDLKGGMNLVLEVKVSDVVKALSGHNTDPVFNQAIDNAIEREKSSTSDFITLFADEFSKLSPNGQLATIFATVDLKDRIDLSMSNSQVIAVIRNETDGAIQNAFNVLRTRIDRFGVAQPNIQELEKKGRVMIELPGVTDPQRVRKLLQGTASLEFWETYANNDILSKLIEADAATRVIIADSTKTVTAKPDSAAAIADSTSLALLGDKAENDTLNTPTSRVESLFTYLRPIQAGNSPQVGFAFAKDRNKVEEYLASDKVRRSLPHDLRLLWSVKPISGEQATRYYGIQCNPREQLYELIAIKQTSNSGRAPLEGDVITNARSQVSQNGGAQYEVSMSMNSEGARKWAQLTKANIGRSIAIVLDGFVYSYPTVQNEISGGNSQITGNFTTEEAQDLANVLKSGKLPAPATIVEDTVVGPSLGQEAIEAGLWSFLIAFVAVLIYMVIFYGAKAGLTADFALICNLFFIVGVLASFGAVLTLPGIAGIVLTIGMAVDANVITFERIKEELRSGHSLTNAIQTGYSNAMSAIVDSNLTTFLTAVILFTFGTGPIRGFATTLMIGIVCSFFTAVFLSRIVIERLAAKDANMKFSTKATENFLQNAKFDFLGKRKAYYIVYGAAMLICIGSLAFRGLSKGIDFTGGQIFVVRFEQPVSSVDIQSSLFKAFDGANIEVKTYGNDNQVRIATNYNVDNSSAEAAHDIEQRLYDGVKSFLPENVDKDTFLADYRMSSQKVGPTMASDMTEKAIYCIVLSLVVMFLYIFARFRKVAYGAAAVVGLTHDVIFTLGVFSLCYSIMPFSMEVDQSFVAAILTIVGYSINNTVVIFDRIRESFSLMPKADPLTVMNSALNSTLMRTFNTSATTLVTLLVIFLLGGEVIRGFVFAMFVGMFVGTFSSMLLATPIAYEIIARKAKKNAKA